VRLLFFLLSIWTCGLGADLPPRFEDFPANKVFSGTPVAPKLLEPWAKMYRTRIEQGVTNPDSAFRRQEYVKSTGPNFAGHYFVLNWGCGTGCMMLVVVDAISGRVFPPPLSIGNQGNQKIGLPMLGLSWADFDYRVDSRLFMIKTCPLEVGFTYPFSGTSYYTIEPNGWKLRLRLKCDDSD
jgi:hypothetical protein